MNMVGSQQMAGESGDEEKDIWDTRRVSSLLKKLPSTQLLISPKLPSS